MKEWSQDFAENYLELFHGGKSKTIVAPFFFKLNDFSMASAEFVFKLKASNYSKCTELWNYE